MIQFARNFATKGRKDSVRPADIFRAPIGARTVAIAFRFFVPFCGQMIGAFAAEHPVDQLEFFEAKIRPIFAEHCYKCHSAESGKSKGSLQLDTRDALLAGGATGPAIVAGDPEKSLLIEAVRYKNEDFQMPPPEEGGILSAEKITALESWVRMGAPDPRTAETKAAAMDIVKAREHWAFQPVKKPTVPAVQQDGWVSTPVDAFVRTKLEAKRLAPAPPADKRTLLRRVTYDLTGLPPTPEETEAFLADRSADAYVQVVERLLASPRYGERWARFWLDVARYADTKGYLAGNVERRYPFSHTYRDYVIRAFNADKPFDRFIVEQLAADKLSLLEDKSALAALGFLTLGRRFLNNQNDIIDDRIDVVTRGLQGLTVSCARCHDHKFDPIPTTDYYSLHGVFASSEEPTEKPLLGPIAESPAYEQFLKRKAELEAKIKARESDEVKKFLTTARQKTGDYLLAAHDAAKLAATEKLDVFAGARKLNLEVLRRWQKLLADEKQRENPVFAPWFAAVQAEIAGGTASVPSAARAEAGPPGNENALEELAAAYNRAAKAEERKEATTPSEPDPAALQELLATADSPPNLAPDTVATMLRREINNKTAGLKREIEALNWTEPGAPLRAMALVDKSGPANSRVFVRGNPANRGAEAPRQFLAVLSPGAPRPLTNGSGRLDLAEEIASAKNPLTARVFVNRVWGWHFGRPLVPTPSDFGVRTAAPVQRELLDWLAASFVEAGWSVKQLHRWIVLSSTYRQSSDGVYQLSVNSNQPSESGNQSRQQPLTTDHRLLNTSSRSDPVAIDPDNTLLHHFPRHRLELEALRDTLLAVAGTLDSKAGGLPEDLAKEPLSRRRTIYSFIDRQNLPGMFRTFDYPNPDVSSAGRFATTVPQQALFMMNSPFVQEQARALAKRAERGTDADTVRMIYRLAYQREPDAEEVQLALAFLRRPATAAEDRGPRASGWQYGYGFYDPAAGRVRDFHAMDVRREGRLSPTAKFPDETFGHVSVTAAGGHPGRTAKFASIRRWVAPGVGRLTIEGTLAHGSANGDGVCGRIVSSDGGRYAEWTVHNTKVETRMELEVQGGETLDFLVDARANANSDGYTWAPNLVFTPGPDSGEMNVRTWNAKKDFENAAKPVPPLTRWEELAQVLLLSNELAFVD